MDHFHDDKAHDDDGDKEQESVVVCLFTCLLFIDSTAASMQNREQ